MPQRESKDEQSRSGDRSENPLLFLRQGRHAAILKRVPSFCRQKRLNIGVAINVVTIAIKISSVNNVGVMMPRDASTRFYADLRLSQSLAPSRLDNGSKRYPTEPTLLVGVAW